MNILENMFLKFSKKKKKHFSVYINPGLPGLAGLAGLAWVRLRYPEFWLHGPLQGSGDYFSSCDLPGFNQISGGWSARSKVRFGCHFRSSGVPTGRLLDTTFAKSAPSKYW